MASCGFNGVDDLSAYLKKTGEMVNGQLCDDLLNAEAEIYVDEWKKAIDKCVKHKDRSTGEMRDAVSAKLNGKKVEVYPMGRDSKGVRNAEKAFIHHYGRKGHQEASRLVDIAENNAAAPALEVMNEVMEKYLNK